MYQRGKAGNEAKKRRWGEYKHKNFALKTRFEEEADENSEMAY